MKHQIGDNNNNNGDDNNQQTLSINSNNLLTSITNNTSHYLLKPLFASKNETQLHTIANNLVQLYKMASMNNFMGLLVVFPSPVQFYTLL
eukprot:UN04864